ncbi:CopG family transcriptional regulator [Nitrospira sp. M1]
MARLTISLSDERHMALKEAAARRGKTIGELIDESLEWCGIKTTRTAEALVAKARSQARLKAKPAMDLAISETRLSRRRK